MVLFDALTEFLRKQALKGANEIINYYSGKYRKIARNYNAGDKGMEKDSITDKFSSVQEPMLSVTMPT